MNTTSKHVRDLSPEEKRALLAQLVSEKAQESETFPLSFAQQRLWFLDQLVPGNPFYSIDIAMPLPGAVDRSALQKALQEIVHRHNVLRTTFVATLSGPVQVVAPALTVSLPIVDLRGVPEQKREAEAQQLATEEAQRPFDLTRGPLVRTTLLQLGDAEYVFLLTLHHIVCDGWSLAIIFNELSTLYAAFAQGDPSPLPELPIQYADFAVWQREWLQGEVLAGQLAYWKRQLDDVSVLQLPTDHPRPAVQSFAGAQHSVRFPAALAQQLHGLSQQENTTLFMTLLAAFQVLLYRYTGQTDIVVGSPIANRTRAEIEGLIGFFVNTLVLRTDLSGAPSFRNVLRRVREVALGAYAHQDLPFEKLVEELQPKRDLSRNPLFQVLFQLHTGGPAAAPLQEATLPLWDIQRGTAILDLAVHLHEGPDGLAGQVEYSLDLFEPPTVARLLDHFGILLEGIVANPDCQIGKLPLLTPSEQEQLLVDWNHTPASAGDARSFEDLFEAPGERTPDAVAVIFGEEQLTFAEVNRRANQLAHALRRQGVGADARVGFCMARSVEMMVGLLGILKAGGAYVPLDPGYPKERLAFMLEDSRATHVITQERFRDRLPDARAQFIFLDREWSPLSEAPVENPVPVTAPGHLAYIMYTSGSTGRPKGVAMPRGALANLLKWQMRVSGEARRTLQFSSLSFDVSFQEIGSTWCAGATLVIPSDDVQQDPQRLLRTVADAGVERVFLPFVALQQMAESSDEMPELHLNLREIITAGEPLQTTPALQRFVRRLRASTLHNQYGPTEAHVVTAFTLTGPPETWPARPPIGRPIANAQAYVLDAHFNLVPIGVPGQLYLGGACLARGYWRRPDLTAERFIAHPFAAPRGSRAYATGDVVRYRSTGDLEFLGRVDHQVKVRGFRVELGEVEAVLRQHAGLHEVAVVIREGGARGPRLVAYLVPDPVQPPSVSALRRWLQTRLPEYMIPSDFAMLESLPLTPTGKVDRRALPAPEDTRSDLAEVYVAPRNPIEVIMTRIWSEILGIEKVGIHDHFFELGGHSLLGTRLISRVREMFHVELPIRRLFEAPTVALLAEAMLEGSAERSKIERRAELIVTLSALSDEEAAAMLAERESAF